MITYDVILTAARRKAAHLRGSRWTAVSVRDKKTTHEYIGGLLMVHRKPAVVHRNTSLNLKLVWQDAGE